MKKCDLLIRNATLEDHVDTVDIAVSDKRIAAIQSHLSAQSNTELDAESCFVSPCFIDPHTHLDKCYLQPEVNISGTLTEAILIMQNNKHTILNSIDERVNRALLSAIKNGTLFIRTHIDVNPKNGIQSIEAMERIKERWADLIDIQIVAFPQDGLIQDARTIQVMREAMRSGATIVGGIPAMEETVVDQHNHIHSLFEIASEFNADIDMHIDESDNPRSRTLEMLADATIASGWHHRVTAAHCCSLAAYDDKYSHLVIEKVVEAGINIITNPPVNLLLQGREDRQPVRRGITRVKDLLSAGVNVACGNDNLRDVFYPFGQCDMLEVAFVTALAAHLSGREEILSVAKMPRQNAAKVLGLKDYGIRVGNPANMVIIPEKTITGSISNRPPRRAVIRHGQLICQTIQNTEYFGLPLK